MMKSSSPQMSAVSLILWLSGVLRCLYICRPRYEVCIQITNCFSVLEERKKEKIYFAGFYSYYVQSGYSSSRYLKVRPHVAA